MPHLPASLFSRACVAATALLLLSAPLARAQEAVADPDPQPTLQFIEANTIDLPPVPHYSDGFAFLAQLVDMGEPLGEPVVDPDSGHVEQLTSDGLAYWLPDLNQATFLDQDATSRYAWTEAGLMSWQGSDLEAPAPAPPVLLPADPRQYLYAAYPRIAPALDRIITCESGWNPYAKNRSSTASGLGQDLNTTWAGTPQGRAGYSVFDPIANIDANAWLYMQQGAWPWLASNRCHHQVY